MALCKPGQGGVREGMAAACPLPRTGSRQALHAPSLGAHSHACPRRKPATYGVERTLPARWKGKQFGTLGFAHSEKTSLTDIYFEKKHNWVGDGDKYQDKVSTRGALTWRQVCGQGEHAWVPDMAASLATEAHRHGRAALLPPLLHACCILCVHTWTLPPAAKQAAAAPRLTADCTPAQRHSPRALTPQWRYIESGQEKKKGFLTSDFSKRDEFSNTVRTLQWREQLEVRRCPVEVQLGRQPQHFLRCVADRQPALLVCSHCGCVAAARTMQAAAAQARALPARWVTLHTASRGAY